MNVLSTWRLVIIPALGIAAIIAACGDDGDEPAATAVATTPAATSDITAFCEATSAFGTLPPPEIDFELATEAEVTEALKEHAATAMLPLIAEMRTSAPGALAGDVEALARYAEAAASTGLFDETPEVMNALGAVEGFGVSECGWREQAVSLVDYAYDGLDGSLESGITLFRLSNDGSEIHAMTVARKNDGVTLTTEEILALPDEEAFQHVTVIDDVGLLPGDTTSTLIDLVPGEYIFVCLVPVGLTAPDVEPAPGAPPHAVEGMLAEVTVN